MLAAFGCTSPPLLIFILEGTPMLYQSQQMEEQAALQTAAQMCAAARTAPKATGKDVIFTLVLTGAEKEALAAKMVEIGARDFADKGEGWYCRDARGIAASSAVVLIGAKREPRGVKNCGFCGFGDCAGCVKAGGLCVYPSIDLGIALGSAAAAAADLRADTRIMMSAGKAAEEMGYIDQNIMWHAIPLSLSGKNIFFDRKKPEGK